MDGLDLLGADDAASPKGAAGGKHTHGGKKTDKETKPGLSDGAKVGITEGAMVAGALVGAIVGSKVAKEHGMLGMVFGFLGGTLISGVGTGIILSRKSV
jgi:hypothetical protein